MPHYVIQKSATGALDAAPVVDPQDRQQSAQEKAIAYRKEKAEARLDHPSRLLHSMQNMDLPTVDMLEKIETSAEIAPCEHCGQVCKTEQGRTSHIRNRHPDKVLATA